MATIIIEYLGWGWIYYGYYKTHLYIDGEGEKMGVIYEKLNSMIREIRDVMVNIPSVS